MAPGLLLVSLHKSTGLSALQLLEKTFHVQNVLGLSLSKGGENG
jgi:hypothetical protein